MTNLDELREKITSREKRLKVLKEINDLTYLGLVDDTVKTNSKKDKVDRLALLHERVQYLRTLVNLCFEQIENLEAEK